MDLRQLTTFKTAAVTLSFTRTAEALDYVQSSVTAQIQALENELGVQLFDRLGKRVALTDAGERLLPYAEKLLDLASEARAAVAGAAEPSGVLTISAPETLCTYRLPPVLHAYRERYPQVTLHLRPAVMMSDLRRAMLEGNVDLAFVLEEPSPAAGLVVEPLLSEVILPLAAPDHRLAGARSVCPIDLQGEALVLTEAGCGYRSLFERSLAAVGVRPGATFDFSSVEAIKQCVIAGMGIAVLPEVAVRAEVAGGRLVPLRWSEPVMQVPIRMVRHKDKWLSPAITAFMEVAREMLAAGADDAPVSTPITSGTAYATR